MAAITTTFALDAILPSEDLLAMGRKRYQRPSVLRTSAKQAMWYFPLHGGRHGREAAQQILDNIMQSQRGNGH